MYKSHTAAYKSYLEIEAVVSNLSERIEEFPAIESDELYLLFLALYEEFVLLVVPMALLEYKETGATANTGCVVDMLTHPLQSVSEYAAEHYTQITAEVNAIMIEIDG